MCIHEINTHTNTNTHAFRILLDCMKLLPQQVIGRVQRTVVKSKKSEQ